MDDYSISSLIESKNEWCARLISIITPAVIVGLKSIFEEADELCKNNDEEDKYLMTFQTFLSRVPKWNNEIIEVEKNRIIEVSECKYLEDLITCVHIIHLKALTCIRVGQQQKKIEIDVPSLDNFIHKVYIATARKVYTNVYLFEKDIPPLNIQKHNRELETLIKEAIFQTIRDNMPVENILRAYISETNEEAIEINEEIITENKKTEENKAIEENKDENKDENKEENKDETKTSEIKKEDIKNEDIKKENNNMVIGDSAINTIVKRPLTPIKEVKNEIKEEIKEELNSVSPKIDFKNTDYAIDTQGKQSTIDAPKSLERLEQISITANNKRKEEEEEDDMPLNIGEEVKLEIGSINDLNRSINVNPLPELEIETLG